MALAIVGSQAIEETRGMVTATPVGRLSGDSNDLKVILNPRSAADAGHYAMVLKDAGGVELWSKSGRIQSGTPVVVAFTANYTQAGNASITVDSDGTYQVKVAQSGVFPTSWADCRMEITMGGKLDRQISLEYRDGGFQQAVASDVTGNGFFAGSYGLSFTHSL